MSKLDIRKASPMPSRPCRWCFALQDDSVFADFDIDDDGRVFLARISFDGFGCCETGERIARLNADSSRIFIDYFETNSGASQAMTALISSYFRDNTNVIWKDALEHHHLLVEGRSRD